jgi:TolB protein
MIRKPFRLMFWILFTITIMSACASPTPTQPVASDTSSPSTTPRPNIPPTHASKPSLTTTLLPSPTLKPTNTAIPAWKMPFPSPNVLPGYTVSPAWLPAGIIAFTRAEGDSKHHVLYLVHTDGTGLVKLADGPGFSNDTPTWSPDGSRIAYASGGPGALTYDLWAINADGTDQVQLTKHPPSGLLPAWSPDGKNIAFSAITQGSWTWQISLMNADGSHQLLLTNTKSFDEFPTWTPNGTILFMRHKDLPGDVFAMNPDGTGIVQLTNLGYVGDYALSPDGTKIAFTNMKDHRIEIIPIDGSGPSVIVVDSDLGCIYVAISWSPDGQALALACSFMEIATGTDLYIVKADGSSITTVPNIGGAFDPAWKP